MLNHANRKYTLAYTRIDDLDEQSDKNKFLQLLGGQIHVKCNTHGLPLIISHQKSKCGKCNKCHQHLCCSVLTCNTYVCKKCFEELDEDMNHLISPQEDDGDVTNDDNSDDEVLHELYNSDDELTVDGDYLFSNNKRENNNHMDDTEDYLGMCDPPDLDTDEFSEIGSQNSFEIGVVNDESDEICPTTNAADEHVEIHADTAYGGKNNKFIISGSGLMMIVIMQGN